LALGYSYLTGLYYGLNNSQHLFILIFFSTTAAYNADRLPYFIQKDIQNARYRVKFHLTHHWLAPLMVSMSLIVNLYILGNVSIKIKIFYIITIFFTALYFYGVNMNLSTFKYRLAAILKPVIVSIVWSLVTVIYPFLEEPVDFNKDNIMFFIHRFLLFFSNCLWFDYRDKEGDLISKKPNIHQYINIKSFSLLLLAICFIDLFIINSLYHKHFNKMITHEFIPVFIYAGIIIPFLKHKITLKKEKNLSEMFYPMIIDGVLALPLFIIWLIIINH